MTREDVSAIIYELVASEYAYRGITLADVSDDTPLFYPFSLDNDIEGKHPSKLTPILFGDMLVYPGMSSFPISSLAQLCVVMDSETKLGVEITDAEAETAETVVEHSTHAHTCGGGCQH